MLNVSTILKYPILTILSIGKKSFENLGRFINKSGDTVSRLLQPAEVSLNMAQSIAQEMFQNKKKLFCIIDDTLIKKIYSQFMQGSGMFFDTKMGRRIKAFRLVLGVISDGKFSIPFGCGFLFSKELLNITKKEFPSKEDLAKAFVETSIKLFPKSKITVVADGLYATVNFLTWCKNKNIATEVRMHSNRVVWYKGKKFKLKDLARVSGITPKGRQMSRTITVMWHEIELEITIVRRIDKHGDETIVFQAATYKALPREHVAHYQKRWPIEKIFRTTKQYLGLQECYSRSLDKQHNHIASVLLAYALTQLDMKKYKLKTPEEALRRSKTKSASATLERFSLLSEDIHYVDA